MRLARHRITTAALLEHIRTFYRHPDDPARDHPRAAVWRRLIDNTGVQQRWWTRPLEEVTAPSGVGRRTEVAFNDALDLGEHAAREAMASVGLGAADIDAIVTSHTTSFSVPNLDVHLVERLGLRPDLSRMPLASLACSGGAQALIRALDYTTARPGARVLVVVAETLSTIYHQSETTPLSMMYRALFGDSAAACVVTGVTKSTAEGLPPVFLALDPFELVMPNSLDRYWGVMDEEGLHFASTKAAASAASDALPHIVDWLDERRSNGQRFTQRTSHHRRGLGRCRSQRR